MFVLGIIPRFGSTGGTVKAMRLIEVVGTLWVPKLGQWVLPAPGNKLLDQISKWLPSCREGFSELPSPLLSTMGVACVCECAVEGEREEPPSKISQLSRFPSLFKPGKSDIRKWGREKGSHSIKSVFVSLAQPQT